MQAFQERSKSNLFMLKYKHMPPLQNPNSFPAPPPSTNGGSPYDFFMDSNNSPRSSMSPGKKLLIILAGAIGLLMILATVIAMLSGGSRETPQLISVLQSQQEIVRVAQDGKKNAQANNIKNFSITASASLASAQTELTTYVGKLGTKIGKNELALGKKPQTDTALKAALASSTYDTTYSSIMQGELNSYEKKLETATAAAVSDSERSLLQGYTVGAQLLRLQLTTP